MGRGADSDLRRHWRDGHEPVARGRSRGGADSCAAQCSAAGFCLFNFDHATAVSIVPGIGLGVGRAPAVRPHRKKMEEGKEQGAE